VVIIIEALQASLIKNNKRHIILVTSQTPGLKDLNNINRECQLTEQLCFTFATTQEGVE
jgi:hypothetical protein